MFEHKADTPHLVTKEQMVSLALLVRHAYSGVISTMPEHSYVDCLGKEYHVRRQRPFQRQAALYRIATTEWAIQFFGSDDNFPWPSRAGQPGRVGVLMIWDCKFAGDQAVFENDLTMFRVALS